MDIKKLLEDVEKARESGKLTDDDLSEFNKTGSLQLSTTINNVHNDELNKTGQNYADNAYKSANLKKKIEFDKADKQTDIEKAANKVKVARSDETRKELLKATGEYKEKQKDSYARNDEIVDTQTRIASRQANVAAAKAGKNGDVYSDGAMLNIKNDIINRYGDNIASAQQYALQTKRSIDEDLLNVGITEVNDKNKRDAFKDALLDKENSYILNALEKAAEGDKKAVTDIENFYQNYVRNKADKEDIRSSNTERREGFENEFASLDAEGKANMLRDLTADTPGFNIIADRIPSLIASYPSLSLGELKGKIMKISEIALTGKQQIPTILAKSEKDRTEVEKTILQRYLERGDEEFERSDRSSAETIKQSNNNQVGNGEAAKLNMTDASKEGQDAINSQKGRQQEVRDSYDEKQLSSSHESDAIKNSSYSSNTGDLQIANFRANESDPILEVAKSRGGLKNRSERVAAAKKDYQEAIKKLRRLRDSGRINGNIKDITRKLNLALNKKHNL